MLDITITLAFSSKSFDFIKPCAYTIKHIKTGKFYIGSTKTPNERKYRHLRHLKLNQHTNKNLQNAYNDDSNVEFSWYIARDREHAFDLEQEILNFYDSKNLLLNISKDVRCSARGREVSIKTRERLRETSTGRKHTPEQTEKIRLKNTGIKRTPEQIERTKKGRLGFKLSRESIEKIRLKNTGKKRTAEFCKITSERMKKRILSSTELDRLRKLNESKSIKIKINSVIYNSRHHAQRELNLSGNQIDKLNELRLPV
jgi:predicted GIY-YIG superfamily endonuclease